MFGLNRETALRRLRVAVLFVVAWTIGAAVVAAAPAQLRCVVIITRHGVRSPTWDNARLNPYAAEPWPQWSVAPGILTPHGRSLMLLLGTYYREWLTSEHLLNPEGCGDAGRVYIHADTDQRTLETGRALAEALLPGCAVAVHSVPEGSRDPLFNPSAVVAQTDGEIAAKVVRERLGDHPERFLDPHRAAFEALEGVLAGGGTPKKSMEAPHELTVTATGTSVQVNESLRGR